MLTNGIEEYQMTPGDWKKGGGNSAETDLVFEGFVLAMLSLPPPLFILLYLCEKVIVGVK